MRGKSYFKNVLSEAEEMYSNATGRRSAFRGQGGVPFVGGCTDGIASNFNPQATCDDGSCDYSNLGCTQTWADNYDPSATYDDGSCLGDISDLEFDEYLRQNAMPYDPIPPIPCPTPTPFGCTMQSAINYNPMADEDDGSCVFGSAFFDPPFQMLPSCPWNPIIGYHMLLVVHQGSVYPRYCPNVTYGCTDPSATNFDPEADQDWILPITFTAGGYPIHHPLSSDVYNNSLESVATLTLCEYASSGGSSGGGIVDIALGTGKDPKGQSKRKRRGMRSATGGGKRSVGTAVNWLTPLI